MLIKPHLSAVNLLLDGLILNNAVAQYASSQMQNFEDPSTALSIVRAE